MQWVRRISGKGERSIRTLGQQRAQRSPKVSTALAAVELKAMASHGGGGIDGGEALGRKDCLVDIRTYHLGEPMPEGGHRNRMPQRHPANTELTVSPLCPHTRLCSNSS